MGVFSTCFADPSLFFNKEDLSVLRERVKQKEYAFLWQEILTNAQGMCSPASRQYADPARIDEGPKVLIQVLAHTFGRRLTTWSETLGFAYQLTGEKRFGQHGVRILLSAANKLPISDPRVAKSFAGARGDLMRGFAVGLDWLGEAMTRTERQQIEQVAAGYVRNILAEARRKGMWWVPYHNFMGVALGGAGLLALKLEAAFPDESPNWGAECKRGVARWLDAGFDEQGAYYEGTGYAHYGLTNAIRFADALALRGDPSLFRRPRLAEVPAFFALSLVPGDRTFDARNDANYAGLGDPWMLRLAGALNSHVAKWLWKRCGAGNSPMHIVWRNEVPAIGPEAAGLPLARHFAGRGLCAFRTGWGTDDVMFAIEAGPFYSITHNQADKGQFTLYGLGQRWAIDSGYGNNRDPEGRAQTVAHNCILIDGRGQAISGAGAGTDGRITAYENNGQFGYALADCTEAYNHNNKGQPGPGALRAFRHTLFIRPSGGAPAYAVILDDVQKDGKPHEFTWMLHTDTGMEISVQPDGAVFHPVPALGRAFVETPAAAKGRGACSWSFDVPRTGRYAVWARVRAAGEERSKSDSFFVSMDGRKPVGWHMPNQRAWTWGKVGAGVPALPVFYDLTEGRHRLKFLTREPGAQVDQLAISAYDAPRLSFSGSAAAAVIEAESGLVEAPMRIVREEGTAQPPRMRLCLYATAPIKYHSDLYDAHPRLNATVRAVAPEFAALLLPLPGGMDGPKVKLERENSGTRIEVSWPTRRDSILWPAAGERKPTVTLRLLK